MTGGSESAEATEWGRTGGPTNSDVPSVFDLSRRLRHFLWHMNTSDPQASKNTPFCVVCCKPPWSQFGPLHQGDLPKK